MKLNMNMLKDESGQGAAEYMLLFGGVIVLAIIALLIYKNYFNGVNFNAAEDTNNVRTNINK